MSKAIKHWWQKLQSGWGVLHRHQQGQSLVIIAFAFVAILALVGLGIDLAAVYAERVKAGRAADAAALAAASELPLEAAAHARALVYLRDNGYDSTAGDAELVVDTFVEGEYTSDPGGLTTIWIDTAYSQDQGQANSADRVRVRVRQQVFMTFMQFIGFSHFPVNAAAEAENISNVDTVIVYDKSGSMEFDTLCYGCWEQSDEQYPTGNIWPLPWADHIAGPPDHCLTDNLRHYAGNDYYIVIEAEEYSRLSADYHNWGYTPYYTFWVIQRNIYNDDWGQNVNAYGRDGRGAYLSHHPYRDHANSTGLGVSCRWSDLTNGEYCRRGLPAGGPFPAPRADYDFVAPADDYYYVWIRGQGGNGNSQDHIFWGVNGSPYGEEDGFSTGPGYDGAASSVWNWRRLSKSGEDRFYLSAGSYTLNLWAGGAGFDVDRIIITTESDTSLDSWERTLAPNNGRTDWACSPCDPRFAGRPGGQEPPPAGIPYRPDCSVGGSPDQRQDAIYDDEQPIRNALESAKHFVGRLDPRFDQVGYVRYSYSAEIANELECLRRRGADNCTPTVITNTVLYELDRTTAGGNTNIAHGMRRGIEVLSTGGSHYGRPGAAHIMVLMTDGEANTYTGCDSRCDDDPSLWPADSESAKDCVVWYAYLARDNAIVVYTISLGWSADRELMEEVAEITGGYHRWAPTSDKLDEIFDELFERIFLRLIE